MLVRRSSFGISGVVTPPHGSITGRSPAIAGHHWRPIATLLLSLAVFAGPTPALALDDDDRAHWLSPRQGDLELRSSFDFSHLFGSGETQFAVELGLGYLVTNWLEIGVSGSLGYSAYNDLPDTPTTIPKPVSTVSTLRQALTLGVLFSKQRALTAKQSDMWTGSSDVWLRWYVFELVAPDLLPGWFSPYVHVEAGPQYTKYMTPSIVFAYSTGFNLYVTEQIALGPEVGYVMVISTDDNLRFGDDSKLGHIIALNWGVSVFFTP